MKATLEQITGKEQSSLTITNLDRECFDGPYHYHHELELTWIRSGNGKRIIGSNISDYDQNDLVLVGSDISHCWKSSDNKPGIRSKAIVVQFSKEFLGSALVDVPELRHINSLIETLNSGIIINGETKKIVISKMKLLIKADRIERLMKFIEILDEISRSAETISVGALTDKLKYPTVEKDRFQRIYSYLINNYQKELNLKDIASLANMTPPAFCRYFKTIARKTFTEVVIEFRINHACHQLKSSDESISQVCFDSGFGNLSHFNKTFKSKTGYSPLQYRNLFKD